MTRVVNIETGEQIITPFPPMNAVIHAVCLHDLGISQNPHKLNLPVENDGIRYKCGKWIAVKGTEAIIA